MIRFKSFCTKPIVPANKQVIAPIIVTIDAAFGANSSNGLIRANKKRAVIDVDLL
jgi:hypothetical protein